MSSETELRDLATRMSRGEATSQEIDSVVVGLLSSTYRENKYRHDETMRMLSEIHELIKGQRDNIQDLEEKHDLRIKELEKDMKLMKPIVVGVSTVTSIATGWAVLRVLGYLFP